MDTLNLKPAPNIQSDHSVKSTFQNKSENNMIELKQKRNINLNLNNISINENTNFVDQNYDTTQNIDKTSLEQE